MWHYILYTSAAAPPGWTESLKQDNALEIYQFFAGRGYTINAIAGIMGNFEVESYVNPGQGEGGGGGGAGLPQYSNVAKTAYLNWAGENGYEWYDGYAQIRFIDEQTVNIGQWISTSRYPMTWTQFKQSTDTAGNLAMAYLYNWERGTPMETQRRAGADKWYNYLSGSPIPPTPPTGGTLPFWLLKKMKNINNGRWYI